MFDESATADDLWATFRAVRALAALGERPDREADCVDWITGRQAAAGSFTRWDDYPDADVWAAFSAVGALLTLGRSPRDTAAVVAFLKRCELPEGGFTYRRTDGAGDSLATSAALLTGTANGSGAEQGPDGLARWLHAAHLPYEGGVMYMPGRGAEVRCTLWAVSALAAARREQLDADRIVAWLRLLHNTDGGFGYWHGRASDMVATASALDILACLGRRADALDTVALRSFTDSCRADTGYRYSPGAAVTAASTAQALRVLHLLGADREDHDADGLRAVADRLLLPYASRLGGFAAHPRGIPDLVSTYQAVLTLQTLGLPVDGPELSRFLDRVRLPDGTYAWSPLGRRDGGPLAGALGTLLTQTSRLPALNL
ncbi:prenyltransferase/squalene oxidase repeat-containing protein [Streptomyces sp. NPDC050528]|uniref:prenyltransferase/squalene oxidase repeat-containing protein n=1 Tax=Streptomyces sp. NPDC050528 TaxID=3365623 RepID=UPI0037BD790E